MIRSHVFNSSREAYDTSQTADAIHDGDVLLVPSEGRVAVLVEAWPVLVGRGKPGAFHQLEGNATFADVHGGKYLNSAAVAIALLTADGMKAVGLSTSSAVTAMYRIARDHGWVPAQERHNGD